jgi:hypothetical protein
MGRFLYVNAAMLPITNSQGRRPSAMVMSSTMPSAKYSWLASLLKIGKGKHDNRRLLGQGRLCADGWLRAERCRSLAAAHVQEQQNEVPFRAIVRMKR